MVNQMEVGVTFPNAVAPLPSPYPARPSVLTPFPLVMANEHVYVLTGDSGVESDIKAVLVGPLDVNIEKAFVRFANSTPTVHVTLGGFVAFLVEHHGLRRVSFSETVVRVAERGGREVALWIDE